MDDNEFEQYCEWANDELIWGKGQGNWRRANSKEEWENKEQMCDYDEVINVHIPF